MNTNRFFKPHVGNCYTQGINGKKVLVMGASFYCANPDCKYYDQCTSVTTKDSSTFDALCPFYEPEGKQLHNEPTYCVEELPQTYRKFAMSLTSMLGVEELEKVWDRLAFTNYCQYFLPAESNFRPTFATDLSDRDFSAFIETCVELQPNVIIVWGSTINRPLLHSNTFVTDKNQLDKTGGYVCHMQLPGLQHPISLVNCYHPSSRAWWGGVDEFVKYLKMELEIN